MYEAYCIYRILQCFFCCKIVMFNISLLKFSLKHIFQLMKTLSSIKLKEYLKSRHLTNVNTF